MLAQQLCDEAKKQKKSPAKLPELKILGKQPTVNGKSCQYHTYVYDSPPFMPQSLVAPCSSPPAVHQTRHH